MAEYTSHRMRYIIDWARHEVTRLKAISQKLSELKLAAIKNETDMLQVLVSAMDWKLHVQRPRLSKSNNKDPKREHREYPESARFQP
jgi:hypothetical protein